MISFNSIPIDLRTPGAYVEFDSSRAQQGLPTRTPRVLLIGPRLAAGTVAANELRRLTGKESAAAWYGAGSILAHMAKAFFNAYRYAEVWAYDLSDAGGGVAATKTITLSGPATAAGTLAAYVAGRKVQVAVAAADTANTIATALAAAINANTDIPATAGAAAAVVTVTAKNKGTPGIGIDVRVNHNPEDRLPAGVTVVIAEGVAGSGDPDFTAAIAAIGDQPFDAIVTAYTDTTSLNLLKTELESRWGPMRQLDGLVFAAKRDTYGNLASFGAARNGKFETVLGYRGPNPPWEWAAAYAAVVMQAAGQDPARPFQTLQLPGLLAPKVNERFTRAERELLLADGISTFVVDQGGAVLLERPITTYQSDANGEPDTSWLDVNTPLTLSYLRWSLRLRFTQRYPRHKLANDGTHFGEGQAVITPKVARAELVSLFREWEAAGLVENIDQFVADLKVERDQSNPNQLNALIPPDLVNQLRVFAAQIQFRL